ncbi:hypothetical protein [Actinomadura sediminis]|uniref:Uncharacterized protein n=1 Tax=Actinomadura sediminis TaxID=1038904 RepID=A0ABW3EQ01_9ACTN
MQCPTCGSHTPGTLGRCSNCGGPVDVYAPGAPPLAAPVADAPADVLGESTMTVPPPGPSWTPSAPAPSSPASGPAPSGFPGLPDAGSGFGGAAAGAAGADATIRDIPNASDRRVDTSGGDGPAEATGESTAPWAFDPDDDDEDEVEIPGLGGPARPAPPAVAAVPPSNPFGLADAPPPTESIVPDSWFAQPRRPQEPEAATQAWTPQAAPGAGALDRTMMDPGGGPAPMGAPHGPMGAAGPPHGPMGPGGPPPHGPGAPMGPPGQGGLPAGYGGTERGGTAPNKVLIAVVSALVTVAVATVALVAWPSGDDKKPAGNTAQPDTTPSSTPVAQKDPVSAATREQAAVMNEVLNASTNTRAVLGAALTRAGKCKTLPQAIQGFETVAQRRQNQLKRTREMKLDQVPNGEQLRTSLSQALQASLDVDQKYLHWARQVQPKCKGKGKPKPSAAQVPGTAADNRRATTAKQRFVQLWNPVAQKTGLPERDWRRV